MKEYDLSLLLHVHRIKGHEDSERMVTYKSGRELSPETNPDNLIPDHRAPERWENKFLLFKSPSLCNNIMAAQANYPVEQKQLQTRD